MTSLMAAYGRLPVTMDRGEGALVWDDQGRAYLDALGGIAVCALGHSDPDIREAIADQAGRLMHVSNLYKIAEQEALGETLCEISGMDKAFFCNSGAEANEACLKVARLHGHAKGIKSPTVIVMDTAFHGRTLATLSATGNTKIQTGFGPLVEGFAHVPFNDLNAIEALASSRNDIVAVMVEPIQGETGIQVPDDNYLPGLRTLCDREGWLLICDEIQSGMGRTGTWFAHQHSGIKADVMSVAKALGNGMPIGACLARGSAAELIQPGSHGTTFGGNPIACRVGSTVIEQIKSRDLMNRAASLGEKMLDGFRSRLHNQPGVVDIRGRGLMMGIELESPCAQLVADALDAGLLINVANGNVVRLLPPYILDDEQAEQIVSVLSELIIAHLAKQSLEQATAEQSASGAKGEKSAATASQ